MEPTILILPQKLASHKKAVILSIFDTLIRSFLLHFTFLNSCLGYQFECNFFWLCTDLTQKSHEIHEIIFGFTGLNTQDDLPVYQPQQGRNQPQQTRVPAPEYYAQDGKTPIYKVFRKHPYGR